MASLPLPLRTASSLLENVEGKARPLGLDGDSHRVDSSVVVPAGRLVEISGEGASARTTIALSLVAHAQADGETAAWIQPASRIVFPPDMVEAGIDLDAIVVVQAPRRETARDATTSLARAAELLLRSGGFGIVVIDATAGEPEGAAWVGRLAGLAREHQARLVVLTHKSKTRGSIGPLVSVRIDAERSAPQDRLFEVDPQIVKNKTSVHTVALPSSHRGPRGAVW